jgi:hypothetical protein
VQFRQCNIKNKRLAGQENVTSALTIGIELSSGKVVNWDDFHKQYARLSKSLSSHIGQFLHISTTTLRIQATWLRNGKQAYFLTIRATIPQMLSKTQNLSAH